MKVLWVETPGTTRWSNMSIEITSQDNRAMRMSVNHLLNVQKVFLVDICRGVSSGQVHTNDQDGGIAAFDSDCTDPI